MRDEVWNAVAKLHGKASIKEVLEFWYVQEKKSILWISFELNCAIGTIKSMLDRFEIPIRKQKVLPAIPKKELKQLSADELVKRYGISRASVYNMKRELLSTKDSRKVPPLPFEGRE